MTVAQPIASLAAGAAATTAALGAIGAVSALPAVRLARRDEEDEIVATCRLLHAENGLFTFDDAKVRGCLNKCYDREGGIVGIVGAAGAPIEATICMIISDMYYTTDWHLAELWNFVLPQYRRSRNAEALLEFAKLCSDKIGVPLITGIITNARMAEKVRLYRRRLGQPAGAFFVYNGHWTADMAPAEEDFFRAVDPRRQAPASRNGSVPIVPPAKKVGR